MQSIFSRNPLTSPVASWSAGWTAAAVGLLGLVFTVVAAWPAYTSWRNEENMKFERQMEYQFLAIDQRMSDNERVLRSLQSFFLAHGDVTQRDFTNLYTNLRDLDQFSSIQALALAIKQPDGNYLTTLVAPEAGNEILFGLNVSSQPVNQYSLNSSLKTDLPTLSQPFRLAQSRADGLGRDGVVLRLPVFSPGPRPTTEHERQARVVGSLAMSFRVKELLDEALDRSKMEGMSIWVVDTTDKSSPTPLYSMVQAGSSDTDGKMWVRALRHGQRVWTVSIQRHPDPWTAAAAPIALLIAGIMITGVLSLMAWMFVLSRHMAVDLAKQLSNDVRRSEAQFRVLNDLLPVVVLLTDIEGRLLYANRLARERFGLDNRELEKQESTLLDVLPSVKWRNAAAEAMARNETLANASVRMGRDDMSSFWTSMSAQHIEFDGVKHWVIVASDQSEMHALTEQLSHQATHDTLTDIPNRRALENALRMVIADVKPEKTAALLYLDLDQFKIINDTSGHHAGDQLLIMLTAAIRDSLPDEAFLARLGGDEFAILVHPCAPDTAAVVAEDVRHLVDQFVFSWENRPYSVSASLGVAMITQQDVAAADILRQADAACYGAKERGRNRVQVHEENDHDAGRRRSDLEWASRIPEALRQGRFEIHVQRLKSLITPEPFGAHVEVLLRLRDERGDLVSPGAFIPAAERFGAMAAIDRWVVQEVLSHFGQLLPEGAPTVCSINLSAGTLDDDSFVPFILELMRRYGVHGPQLCFEITETAAMVSRARAIAFMQRLRAVGCRFALDDFGSGMASFGYLKYLPVDTVKIDGSFVSQLLEDVVSQDIVRSVTQIAHRLGLQVVAEWPASQEALDMLQAMGVDWAQGFFVHTPEPAEFVAAQRRL